MGLIDRIKRRLPLIGVRSAPAPAASAAASARPAPPPEEPEPASPRGSLAPREFIEQTLRENPVVLFMKGTPASPQCGFSATAAGILSGYGKPLHAVNILSDEEIRQGVKDFTGWPTIPQIFIKGEFVGGSDILRDLHQSGELKKLLDAV